MNGFFRDDGTWVQREHGAPQGSQQQALEAVRQAVDRVCDDNSKASDELRQLLRQHPVLRQELKDKDNKHPLSPLMTYYAEEIIG